MSQPLPTIFFDAKGSGATMVHGYRVRSRFELGEHDRIGGSRVRERPSRLQIGQRRGVPEDGGRRVAGDNTRSRKTLGLRIWGKVLG